MPAAASRPAEIDGFASRAGFLLYDLALLLGGLIALPWLAFRLATRERYRAGLLERLAWRLPQPRGDRRRVWIHAASAGEMVAVLALRDALAKRRPDLEIVLSSTTSSGVAVAARAGVAPAAFVLPFDLTPCVRRVVERVDADALVLVELELWPNLARIASSHGVAIGVANGRISERTARRWRSRFVRRFVGAERVASFMVQNEEYRDRLRELSIPEDRIVVTGNLKIDRAAAADASRREEWRACLGIGPNAKAIVAGSTHPGEENAVATAARALESEGRSVRLVIAPRHKERLGDAEREVASTNYKPVRLTALRAARREPVEGEAVMVDTMGELASLYSAADVAFVGGTLLPGVGGHNVFEPVIAGAPTVSGSNLKNVRADASYLVGYGALRVVGEASELRGAFAAAFDDDGRLRKAASDAVGNARGAADRTCEVIEARLLREALR